MYVNAVAAAITTAKLQNVMSEPNSSFIVGNIFVTTKTRLQFNMTATLEATAFVSAENSSPISIHGIGPNLKVRMFLGGEGD